MWQVLCMFDAKKSNVLTLRVFMVDTWEPAFESTYELDIVAVSVSIQSIVCFFSIHTDETKWKIWWICVKYARWVCMLRWDKKWKTHKSEECRRLESLKVLTNELLLLFMLCAFLLLAFSPAIRLSHRAKTSEPDWPVSMNRVSHLLNAFTMTFKWSRGSCLRFRDTSCP